MFFFFPIGHDEGAVRRWPVVTVLLIVACVLVHAAVFPSMERQAREVRALQTELTRYKMTMYTRHAAGGAQGLLDILGRTGGDTPGELIAGMGSQVERFWEAFAAGRVVPADHEDYRGYLDLRDRIDSIESSSLLYRFAFRPDLRSPLTLFTSLFLHGGVLHLLFNMYFLYLFGAAVEDKFGRLLFLLIYLAGGAAGNLVHAAMNAGSGVPVIGASGAVMAVMGAFGVRFWRSRFKFFYFVWLLVRIPHGVARVPAWIAVPMYLAIDLFHGLALADVSTVAHFAHIGGLLFGAAVAAAIKATGLEEKYLSPRIEQKVETEVYRPDERLVRAQRLLLEERFEEALVLLRELEAAGLADLHVRRDTLRALIALGRKADAKETAMSLVDALVEDGRIETAEEVYEEAAAYAPDFSAGGKAQYALASRWDKAGDAERAIAGYRNLVARWPGHPLAPKSLIRTAALTWEALRDAPGAFRLYKRVLERYPDSPLAGHVRDELKRLGGGRIVFD